MKLAVCVMGGLIMAVALLVAFSGESVSVLNPKWEDWKRAQEYDQFIYRNGSNPGPEPPQTLTYNVYPYAAPGAIVFLVGLVALAIGYAMPTKTEVDHSAATLR